MGGLSVRVSTRYIILVSLLWVANSKNESRGQLCTDLEVRTSSSSHVVEAVGESTLIGMLNIECRK